VRVGAEAPADVLGALVVALRWWPREEMTGWREQALQNWMAARRWACWVEFEVEVAT
jgi:hypothetical protein